MCDRCPLLCYTCSGLWLLGAIAWNLGSLGTTIDLRYLSNVFSLFTEGEVPTPQSRYLPPSQGTYPLTKVPTPYPGQDGGRGTPRYLSPASQPRYLPSVQVRMGKGVPQVTNHPPKVPTPPPKVPTLLPWNRTTYGVLTILMSFRPVDCIQQNSCAQIEYFREKYSFWIALQWQAVISSIWMQPLNILVSYSIRANEGLHQFMSYWFGLKSLQPLIPKGWERVKRNK